MSFKAFACYRPIIYNIFFAFYLFMSLGFAHAEGYFYALRRL